MKKLLITGFAPFGGEQINPSWEAVSRLPDRVGDFTLTRMRIPVTFGEAAAQVIAAARSMTPDVIISVGQAAGRSAVTPEFVAINLRHANIPDNAGNRPLDLPVIAGGPAAYFSTLPVRRMVGAISAAGIAAAPSYSAGTFVCNDVFYTLSAHFAGSSTRVGFIHIPCLPEQVQGEKPSLPLTSMCTALCAAIEAIDSV